MAKKTTNATTIGATFEILQIIPAPLGWAMRFRQDDGYFYDWPLALALCGARRRRVTPVTGEGGLADDCANFDGMEYVGPVLPEPVSGGGR